VIIIKILFESVKDKSPYQISKSDVNEIDKDPTKYIMKRLKNRYILDEWFENINRYHKEISKVLSLLNAIVNFDKGVPSPFLDFNFIQEIFQLDNYTKLLLYKIMSNTMKTKNLINISINEKYNEFKIRMPFFELNYKGFIVPMHDIVRGGINKLIQSDELKDYFIDYTNRLIGDFNLLYNKIGDAFQRNDLIKIGHNIKNAYYLLSLSIISDKIDYQIKSLEFASQLSQLNENIDIDLLSSQLNTIFRNVLQEHELLKSIQNGIIENLIGKLLKTNDQEDRLESWDLGLKLLDKEAISKEIMDENKSCFKELLSSENDSIRINAWYRVKVLIDKGIISKEDVIDKKKYFKELLSSEDDFIRIYAWDIVTELIDKGIISKDDAIDKKESFKELLSSEDDDIRIKAWDIVTELIDKGIISKGDAIDKKESFKELLSSENDIIRSDAWNSVTELIDKGIISKDDAIYFKELLSSKNGGIRWRAWNRVTDLIDKGIISKDDAIDK